MGNLKYVQKLENNNKNLGETFNKALISSMLIREIIKCSETDIFKTNNSLNKWNCAIKRSGNPKSSNGKPFFKNILNNDCKYKRKLW